MRAGLTEPRDDRSEIADFIENRFHPPGACCVPSGIDCPPPANGLGALSTRRRSPRESMANAGARCMSSWKPRTQALLLDEESGASSHDVLRRVRALDGDADLRPVRSG